MKRRAPDTRRAAYLAAMAQATERGRKVLDYLRESGGATDDEGHEALGMDKNTYAPTRCHLADLGLVVDSGQRRPTRLRHPAAVWVAAPQPADVVVRWDTLRCGACGWSGPEPKAIHTVMFGVSCPKCGGPVDAPAHAMKP